MRKTISGRLKKLAPLLAFSVTLYFVINIALLWKDGSAHSFFSNLLSIKTWAKIILLNWTTPLVGVGHLWYLLALCYVYLILLFVNKHGYYKIGYIYSAIVIVSIYVLEIINANQSLGISQIYYRNAWFMGFSFFMFGHLIRRNECRLKLSGKKLRITIALLALSIIATFSLERRFMVGDNALFVCNILTALLVFVIGINNPSIKILNRVGELDSGNIYVFHYAIIMVTSSCFGMVTKNPVWIWSSPIIIFLISIAISAAYRYLQMYLTRRKVHNKLEPRSRR